jgi:hypothetical protein
MKKVFASGSCRLLTTINDGRGKIEPIHSMFLNFFGINFLGKLHCVKQHIQFIKWILDEIEIPQYILNSFLTSYSERESIEDKSLIPQKKKSIKDAFNDCDYFIFEICSIKNYEKDGYQVQYELTDDYIMSVQDEISLYEDLKTLVDLIPKKKQILFQTHFRPNIIHNDDSKTIDKREIIYNILNKFCNENSNTKLYDPSIILINNSSLMDDETHFSPKGYVVNFNYLYDNFIQKVETVPTIYRQLKPNYFWLKRKN